MKPPPLQLPPGRCLTDVWADLPHVARRRWLAVVMVEARAVRAEARAARPVGPWTPEGLAAVVVAERAAIARRRDVMLVETDRRMGRRSLRATLADDSFGAQNESSDESSVSIG